MTHPPPNVVPIDSLASVGDNEAVAAECGIPIKWWQDHVRKWKRLNGVHPDARLLPKECYEWVVRMWFESRKQHVCHCGARFRSAAAMRIHQETCQGQPAGLSNVPAPYQRRMSPVRL